MKSVGMTVETIAKVQTLYINDSKFHSRPTFAMTETMVVSMTQYSNLLFIDADILVLLDLSAEFHLANSGH